MPIQDKTTLKSYFKNGEVPTESNYVDLIDSIPASYTNPSWGDILGTLSNQTDLKNLLDAKLNLSGGTITGQLISSVITGLAPLIISSITLVQNLNADMLDGKHASEFALAGQVSSSHYEILQDSLGSIITDSNGIDILYVEVS